MYVMYCSPWLEQEDAGDSNYANEHCDHIQKRIGRSGTSMGYLSL